MVFQSYALFPHMTVAENVAFGLKLRRIESQERDKRVREALQMVRLSGLSDRYTRQLSGGQQQRVALARALVVRPEIMLYDEPLSKPRCQAARGDAHRASRASRASQHHQHLRHPRSGRSAGSRRPGSGHERRADRAARDARRGLREARDRLRRQVPRRIQRPAWNRLTGERPPRWSATSAGIRFAPR